MATVSVFVFIESTDGVFLFVLMTPSGTILAILPLGTSNDSTDFLKHRGQKDYKTIAKRLQCSSLKLHKIKFLSTKNKNSMICSYSHRLFE